jgi:hypothetical protein
MNIKTGLCRPYIQSCNVHEALKFMALIQHKTTSVTHHRLNDVAAADVER